MVSPVVMNLDPNGNPVSIDRGNFSLGDTSPFMTHANYTVNNSNAALFKKLGDIFGELGWISKGNTMGTGSFSYEYTSEAQFIAEVRPLFVKHRIMMIPTHSQPIQVHIYDKGNGKVSYMTTVNMEYQLVDCDTGQSVTIAMPGQGVDPGDKGIYKALTGALKYALREAFLIGTGDDPERYDDEGKVVGKENGKAESRADRGKRVIKEMLATLPQRKEVTAILTKKKINVDALNDNLDQLKYIYNLVEAVGKGVSLADAEAKFNEELGG